MATMNVSLSDEFAEFINGAVASGEYSTASEVVSMRKVEVPVTSFSYTVNLTI